MLEKLRSWLERAGITFSSSTNNLEIRNSKLTVTRDGKSQTFDLTAGVDHGLGSELARMGLSEADLEALIHLADHAGFGSEKLTLDQRTLRSFSGSPKKVSKVLSEQMHLSPEQIQSLLKSGKSETTASWITVDAHGQRQTYDTTSGLTPELSEQLARQMGISPPEVEHLLRLGQSSSAQALPSPSATASEPCKMMVCPGCGHQIRMSKHCVYCGKVLEDAKSAAGENS